MNHPHPRNNSRSVQILIATCFTLGLIACQPNRNAKIAGHWKVPGSKETMEFRNDGTCRGVDEYGRPITGSFTLLDDERIQLEFTITSKDNAGNLTVDKASGTCKLVATGDSLTLVEPDGTMKAYRKSSD
jgi:hypothetical protein